MALKFCAIFGGPPAGPPWGWLGLKDMILLWPAECMRKAGGDYWRDLETKNGIISMARRRRVRLPLFVEVGARHSSTVVIQYVTYVIYCLVTTGRPPLTHLPSLPFRRHLLMSSSKRD